MATTTRTTDLLILGSGPAGLAAAWRAARRGLSVVVLERSSAVGGLAGSFEVAGLRVDYGSHRLHPATPAPILDDLRSLLGDDLQTRPRDGRLRFAGRWVGFPLRPGELVRVLPSRVLAGVAVDAVAAPVRRRTSGMAAGRAGGAARGASPSADEAAGGDSYAATLRRGLGPTLYDGLYAPYARKLWGLPGEQISAEQARRRVSADSPGKIAARVLRGARGTRRGRGSGTGQGRVFYYPRRGYGQIAEALADAAAGAGAEIRLHTPVEHLDLSGGTPHVVAGDGATFEAGHVFSTIPLPALAAMTSPGPGAKALEAARRLRFRAMVLVYLVHGGGRWTPYDAHYLPDGDTPLTRISEPANYRRSPADPADRTVVCCEIPCAVGDEIWNADAEDLRALAERAVAGTGLPALRVEAVEVRRIPRVYPIYELGYERHLEQVDRWSRSAPGLTTFGRLGLFAHDNAHHAMVMAYDAVDALTADGFDRAAWNAARARFADHTVED